MKTPTLIVRLVGLYLTLWSVQTFLQLRRAAEFSGEATLTNPFLADAKLYAWLALIVGIAATAFAGPLARLVTFDAASCGKSREHLN
ncbi:MAG: hypothetical protein NVV63_05010 [Opitutus sp.]|nr:hypothetical protein [Opitutus sp.]